MRVGTYLKILWASLRVSAIADLEFRLNIAVRIFTDIIWYAAQLSVFEVIFRHTHSISGWTLERTRVFMCVLFVVDAFWMFLFQENLDRFSQKIRRGDLDLLLTKPVNAQFMISFQKFSAAYLGNILVTLAMLVYALMTVPGAIHAERLIILFITVPCALGVTYGIRFIFSASALIFTRSENINYLWFQFYRLGMRPDAVYPPWLRWVVLTAIPVGFIASVPARILLDPDDTILLAAAVLFAAFSVYVSTRFWRFALRFYTSASS
jgi:ABC-2 type transport system permease protein